MNCFNHPQLVAVGVCQDCQKVLCSECGSKFSIPICSQCNSNRKRLEKKKINKELLITFGFAIIASYFVYKNPKFSGEFDSSFSNFEQISLLGVMIYGFASIIAGWKTLSALTSKSFLFLPIIGWLIYFYAKLMLASLIGTIMLPIRTFKNIRRNVSQNEY